MALVTTTRWQSRRWNAAGIERLDGVPTAVLDCWGVRLRKRWLSAALAGGRSVGDGYEFDLSSKARLRWLHRPTERLPDALPLEGGLLKEQIVLDNLAAVPNPAIWQVLIEHPPGVTFHYQGELTPQEVAFGAVRRPAVVGSYAVYDRSGCKIGHVLRPFAETAAGQRRWLSMTADPHPLGTVFTILADRAILAALPPSAWPVTIDPTFGHTAIGATTSSTNQWLFAGGPHAPASSGDVTSISAYMGCGGGLSVTLGIYSDSSGPSSLLKDTAGATETGTGWKTQNLDSAQAVVSGTSYWLAQTASYPPSWDYYYDAVGGFSWAYMTNSYSAGSLPASWSGAGTLSSWKESIYATYEEAQPAEGSGVILGIASILGAGYRAAAGDGQVAAVASVAGAGARASRGSGSVAAVAAIAGAASRPSSGSGSIAAVGVVAGQGSRASAGSGDLTAVATIAGEGEAPPVAPAQGSGQVAAVATIAAAGQRASRGSGILAGVAQIIGVGSSGHVFVPPGRVAAAAVRVQGAASGRAWLPGTAAAGLYLPGAVAGEAAMPGAAAGHVDTPGAVKGRTHA